MAEVIPFPTAAVDHDEPSVVVAAVTETAEAVTVEYVIDGRPLSVTASIIFPGADTEYLGHLGAAAVSLFRLRGRDAVWRARKELRSAWGRLNASYRGTDPHKLGALMRAWQDAVLKYRLTERLAA